MGRRGVRFALQSKDGPDPDDQRQDVHRRPQDLLPVLRRGGPKGFSKSAANFKYHWQAAFYLDGLRASGDFGEVEDFVFVVVEKEPPYGVGIYRASDQFVQIGRDQYREAMENFAVCQRDDHWPGYDTKIVDLELPRWAA